MEASREAKIIAEGNGWRFKMPFVRVSDAGGNPIPPGLSGQTHVCAGVREHVKTLGWKTRYDELMKLFDENLQKS